MKFDQTSIAIRERSHLEIYDLAAIVMVRHIRPIMVLLLLNALPFALLDYYLVGWVTGVSFSYEFSTLYYTMMLALIASQAQLGTCLITIFMGRVMFMEEHSVRAVLRLFFKRLPYFLFSQGILRLALFAVLLAWVTPHEEGPQIVGFYVGLRMIAITAILVRSLRPYLPEVIFLEQTPLKKKGDLPSLSERSKNLHSLAFYSCSLIWQFILMRVTVPLMLFAVHSVFIMLDSMLSIRANSEQSLQPFYLLASGWFVAAFFAIVQFLMYINVRIRQEGWAVQLKFMTENSLLTQSQES